jgi:hypothetical protein
MIRSASSSKSRSQGPENRLEMQMEARCGTAVEAAAQKPQHLGQRADVADDDAQLAFLAHRRLARMVPQETELLEEDARAVVKGPARIGQGHSIAVALEEAEPQLGFRDS